MSLTARVLIGLVAGLVAGIAVSLTQNAVALGAVSVLEPIGALWVNAIRMTVIPLVVSLLVTGVASTSARQAGSIGWRAVALFVALVAGSALLAALAAPPLLSLGSFDTEAFAAMRETTATTQVELPAFRDWIVNLVPANPIRAAADGAMLPLIVFSGILALAILRLEQRHRETLVDFFDAVSRAMLVIVNWILLVAPVGVFCLVLPLAARTGLDLVGAMGVFILVACGLVIVALIALYPVAMIGGGISLRRFARACAPAQAVGFSTRSSLASLPAMLEAAEEELELSPQVSGIALPVAVALLKYASPPVRITGTIFVARLYGIDLGVLEIATIAAALGALSFYSPGIPSGGLFIMTPVYIALGLPVEGIGLLIALDMIPDMFITTANVTADMTVAVLLRSRRGTGSGSAAEEPG